MPGRIATVPFDLGIGNCKSLSIFDVRATQWYVVAWVSDDGDILVALHFITVGPIGVRQPTAAEVRLVWPHQLIEPFANCWIETIPLTQVACRSRADKKDKDRRPNGPG